MQFQIPLGNAGGGSRERRQEDGMGGKAIHASLVSKCLEFETFKSQRPNGLRDDGEELGEGMILDDGFWMGRRREGTLNAQHRRLKWRNEEEPPASRCYAGTSPAGEGEVRRSQTRAATGGSGQDALATACCEPSSPKLRRAKDAAATFDLSVRIFKQPVWKIPGTVHHTFDTKGVSVDVK